MPDIETELLTRDSTVTKQDLANGRLNPFAVELVTESYRSVTKDLGKAPYIRFAFDGVAFTLEPFPHRPIDIIIHCPACGTQHIDEPDPENCMDCGHAKIVHRVTMTDQPDYHDTSDACGQCLNDGVDDPEKLCRSFNPWLNPPHKKHRCLNCNHVFKVANIPTNGVAELPEVPK